MKVAYTTSAGSVHGRLSNDKSFTLRCLNNQLMRPLLAESIASWNMVITVSGKLDTSASYKIYVYIYV